MSFALKHKYPGLRCEAEALSYKSPEWGRLYGVIERSYIRALTRAPSEPFLLGYCALFTSTVDCTHEGNDIECELMKEVGTNFWRPQFEAADAMPDRVRPLWEYCKKYDQRMVINQTHWKLHIKFWERVAKDCRNLPPDTVWYDLINEPAGLAPEPYQKIIEELTKRIRAIDKVHPIIIETPNSYASVTMFPFLKPTGDTNTLYSFHYYSMWANRRKLQRDWLPAIRFGLQHGVRIHLGEYGTNAPATYDGHIYCLNDYITTCEQFDIPSHFWSNRHIVRRLRELRDGSLRLLLYDKAFRDRLIWERKPHYCLDPRGYRRYP